MHITIITAIWKRRDITELFFKGVKHLQANSEHTIDMVVVGSEGRSSQHLVESNGFIYVEYKNSPLAAKMNAAMLRGRETGADYYLCVGSDDIIHPSLMRCYTEPMNQGKEFIGVLDWYFTDTVSGDSLYWSGYSGRRKGHTCGAGRMLSRSLLDKWGWIVWENKDSKILDDSMQRKLHGVDCHTFRLTDTGAWGLDIKSAYNMTPFARWENTVPVDTGLIRMMFPYLWDRGITITKPM